ncbi:hypothetical protein CsatB_008024 [Cannabis sativa]|uniref:uncharacterized protein LOC115724071 n=1 Tax=Cannabis sativa TaxID=3483 RepID=UPI0011DFB2BE|nr:uncharacterized protein LOC115724071 [Cannabis sativa]
MSKPHYEARGDLYSVSCVSFQAESTSHDFISCPIALACWRRLGVTFVFDPGGSFRSWLELLFQSLSEEIVCSVSMTCWAIWKARNKIIWKKKSSSVTEIIAYVNKTLNQWKKAQDKITFNSLCLENKGDGAELWSKPEENSIKINVDATTFEQENKCGFDIVIRNHLGNLITALSGCYGGNFTAEVIEVMAIKEALS